MISLGVSAGSGVGGFRRPLNTGYGSSAGSDLYSNSVEQQAEDYSGIMKGYQDLYKNYNTNPAFTNISGLAQSGGYSPEGISDLRERGISPIRAIYANANRDIDRQRALQGGYSPGYGALKAKMARELSDKIGGAVTNVNAGIAQNQAQNRINLAPSWLSASTQMPLDILNSMRGLYGTTPALPALYGQQSLEATRLNNETQNNAAGRFGQFYNAFRR